MHGTSYPKSQLKSTRLTATFWSFLDHAKTGKKGQHVISSFVQLPISLIFALHVSFIIHLPMMQILLTKPMQKSVNTVCLHCNFARLKNKHIGVLGTNVGTISWLHWSQCLGISMQQCKCSVTYWTSFFIQLCEVFMPGVCAEQHDEWECMANSTPRPKCCGVWEYHYMKSMACGKYVHLCLSCMILIRKMILFIHSISKQAFNFKGCIYHVLCTYLGTYFTST